MSKLVKFVKVNVNLYSNERNKITWENKNTKTKSKVDQGNSAQWTHENTDVRAIEINESDRTRTGENNSPIILIHNS